jgi:hypothetical protein
MDKMWVIWHLDPSIGLRFSPAVRLIDSSQRYSAAMFLLYCTKLCVWKGQKQSRDQKTQAAPVTECPYCYG